MEEWVSDGTAPPDSIYPGLKGEGLVALADMQMPEMAGSAPEPKFNVLHVMDYSSTLPTQGAAYDARVPAVDEDGFAVVGVKLPYIAAPVGTYMGWNIRSDGFTAGELCGLTGSFVPFPATDTSDDSRSPTTARYENADAYTQAVRAAAEALVAEDLMLASDVDLVVETAPKLEQATQ